ncbi:MAG: hypothetical protein ACXW1W_13635 [Methylococcaceae bacterium]
MFKIVRIVILLAIFVGVAFYSKAQKLKARSWSEPLEIVIYPINGDDDSADVNNYINELEPDVFAPVDKFIKTQSQSYDLIADEPTHLRLGSVITEQPPESPLPGANYAAIIWWSLKLRYWVYQNTPDSESNLHRVRMFVIYHEAIKGRRLEHSLGLDKGLVAVVHAFASIEQDQQNNIVITHELLHTVGATDKYDANNEPIFPIGYAAPEQSQRYPQYQAEIMAVRIPISATHSRMADNLDQCVIGEQTAKEINWL